jgi:hypothetical protein
MSWIASAWTKNTRVGDPVAKNVLYALADHVQGDSWLCWPSQETIAFEAECSVRTVQRKLDYLEEKALIQRRARGSKQGGRTTDIYRLNPLSQDPRHRKSDNLAGWKGDIPDELGDTALSGELEEEPEGSSEEQALPPPSAPRQFLDPLFDAVAFWCCAAADHTALTSNERGRINHAVRQLRDVGATADDVRARVRRYRVQWPELPPPSPQALLNHWNQLGPAKNGTTPPSAPLPEPEYLTQEENARRLAELAQRVHLPQMEEDHGREDPAPASFVYFDAGNPEP